MRSTRVVVRSKKQDYLLACYAVLPSVRRAEEGSTAKQFIGDRDRAKGHGHVHTFLLFIRGLLPRILG